MPWSSSLAALLLLLVAIISDCRGYKPLINPNVPELKLNEGEKLEITCTSIEDIEPHYPEDDRLANIETSPHNITYEDLGNGSKKLKFTRDSVVFGDTGYYGCSNGKANYENKNYDDPNASWVYVYVRSDEHLFVGNIGYQSLFGSVGDTIILPCRPTSKELHVQLKSETEMEEMELNENLSFDPRVGFRMENLSALDSNTYFCEIEHNGTTETLTFLVKLIQKSTLKTPVILKDGLEYVTKGSSLHVKCTVTIGIDNNFDFYWTTPRNSSSRTIRPPVRRRIEANTQLVTSELVEENVTYDDEGEYVCKVKSLTDMKSTSTYIRVHDPSIKYINLTSHDKDRHYVINAFKSVTFSAEVKGYPTPSIMWLSPDGKEILSNNRITVENKNSSTTLKIQSVEIRDMGTYLLQAFNDDKEEHLNFTLEVLARPLAILRPVEHYYVLNERASFGCKAVGNPTSNMSWAYFKCPNLPSEEGCEKVELEDARILEESGSMITGEVEATIEMSGRIKCTACNRLGCDSSEQNVLVSDGVPDTALGIIEPEEKITAGDDVVVTCAASIYNFTTVEWLDANEEPLQDSQRLEIKFEETGFTHRTILTIKNVQKEDEGHYFCRALSSENPSNPSDTIRYELLVNDPEAPYFTYVNMNGSEVTIAGREAYNNLHLICRAGGMPKPHITWYKDDEPLKFNEEQFYLSSESELVIRFLMEKDSGKYSCVAENRVGKETQFQKILVKGTEVSMMWMLTIVILLIVLIALSIYFCIKIRRERSMRKQLVEAGLIHFEEGALDCINPELTVDDQAELLPYDKKWEFPREKLKLGKQLGSGAFGVVMKAEARGIVADESLTTVAVKMVRRNAEPAYIRALASELKIMVHLGKHLNVVNLLGACTNNIAKRELLVIVEYCRYGNLHNYLLRHRANFINQIDPVTGQIDPNIGQELLMRSTSVTSNNSLSAASGNSAPGTETVIYCTDTKDVTGIPDAGCINSNGSQPGWRSNYRGDYKDRNLKPICTQDLLSWAFQVARGMEYLCQRKVLHGDLAARNILLAENNVVKICDFGLAKTMYKNDNYKKQGDGPVPIKWMAIESIRDWIFSTQSDIWSFGIVLWEFFTLAETPYPGMQAEKQYQKLIEGYRMEQPKYATKAIYDTMLQCWKAKPTLRPSFTELVENIGELLEEGVRMHYVDLNTPYLDMNTAGLEGKDDYLTMMSAPDHAILMASPEHEYVNGPPQPTDSAYLSMNSPALDESGIFSPRPNEDNSRFQFPNSPSTSIANAAHSDGEDAPMLKKTKEEPEQDEDNYLKPIDVHKKREEFMRQREAEKKKERERSGRRSTDRDSGYCNTPKNLELVDVKVEVPNEKAPSWTSADDTDTPSVIIRTQDNYVNMPKQKKDVPDSFMNPSYIFVEANKPDRQDIL
ncbi:vascular endothelial growth factor receptor 1 isoform X2 [Nasonia vitripennis]|uniref:receptor protein-tyrosine kinase n=1 Tax=Nasonia vitripennis TaxID=7425 RepID=A0A7M7G2W2_NASVI|nr:vascular endothelial growth factor receptor 1 isoform X2 [Nasonia vitripennis]